MSATIEQPQSPFQGSPRPEYDEPVKKKWYQQDFYFGNAIKLEELMNFSRQASAFMRAGVPILDSLAVITEEGASKKLKEVLTDLQRRLRSGSSFGDALARTPKSFPGYYIAVVRAAELTGRLDYGARPVGRLPRARGDRAQRTQERAHVSGRSCSSSQLSP